MYLISKDKPLIDKVKDEISKQLKEIPRSSIARQSLSSNGIFMYISSDKKIVDVDNLIAHEHLELNVKIYNFLDSAPSVQELFYLQHQLFSYQN